MGCMFKDGIELISCPVFYNNGQKCPDSKECKHYEESDSNTSSVIIERYEAIYDPEYLHRTKSLL